MKNKQEENGTRAIDEALVVVPDTKEQENEPTPAITEDVLAVGGDAVKFASPNDFGDVKAGSVGDVEIDSVIPGMIGAALGRMYGSMRVGSRVIVSKEANQKHGEVVKRYFGEPKKNGSGYVYTKRG